MEEIHGVTRTLISSVYKGVFTGVNIVVFKGETVEGVCIPADHVPGTCATGTGLVAELVENIVLVNELSGLLGSCYLCFVGKALKLKRTACTAAQIMPGSEVGVLDSEYPGVCIRLDESRIGKLCLLSVNIHTVKGYYGRGLFADKTRVFAAASCIEVENVKLIGVINVIAVGVADLEDVVV